jgi:hypothetical protein
VQVACKSDDYLFLQPGYARVIPSDDLVNVRQIIYHDSVADLTGLEGGDYAGASNTLQTLVGRHQSANSKFGKGDIHAAPTNNMKLDETMLIADVGSSNNKQKISNKGQNPGYVYVHKPY